MNLKVLLSITVATAFSASTWAADWTVGANAGNVPWEFQNAQGEIIGFEIDLVNEVANRAGKTVEFVNIPFNGLFSAVQSGRTDIAISSITITPKRLESVGFAQPYYDSDQSLATLSKSKIKGVQDMQGKVVGVDTGSTGDMWVGANKAEYKFSKVSRYEGLSPAMLDLASGRLDGYISDIPAILYYIKDKSQYKVVERIATGEKYSFIHPKGWASATQVNDIITAMKNEGVIADLHKKWFGVDADPDSSTVKVVDVLK
jgi:polar amino acid transport system substrate-binding protein